MIEMCAAEVYFTITAGHAFGGDYGCINAYTALVAAKHIFKADIAIIKMGPCIPVTNTKYGFPGIEEGYIIDCVNTLNVICLALKKIVLFSKISVLQVNIL